MVLDHEFPPDIRVENEIEALTEQGHRVHIACFTMKGLPVEDTYQNAKIHRKPISKFIHKTSVGALRFPFYFNFWRSFLDNLNKNIKFEAIHIHDLPLAKVGYEISEKYNLKFVLDLHENWPALLDIATHTNTFLGKILSNTNEWKKYEIKYCNLANSVIVVVDEAKQRLEDLGIDAQKISVVSNTLNVKHFTLTNETPNNRYFKLLYAGGINRHRGLQYVIKGLKYLKHEAKEVRLQILGTGSYLDELKELAKKEDVGSMVEFAGWKPYNEMIKYVGKADVCLIPHVKNDHTDSTIPHKLFQYMYAGKPIIASNCAPIERIINVTESGLVYPYDDPEVFAQMVKKLLNETEDYDNFAKSGKANVLKDYTWDIDSKSLNSIYCG